MATRKNRTKTWVPITDEEAVELLGESVHTGLRKGSEAPSSHGIWKAIADSKDSAWGDAMDWTVWALGYMGFKICKQEDPPS